MSPAPLLAPLAPRLSGDGLTSASPFAGPRDPSELPSASTTHLALDLHLHSAFSRGVSDAMTLENILVCAQRKGLDILGTGDCLQPQWLEELEGSLLESGSGLLRPGAELESTGRRALLPRLRRPVRFILSTEVCCAPRGTRRSGGLHHLLYFRSFASVRRFRARVERYGSLDDGRPTLALSSIELLALVLEHGDGCELAPAHILNPWFSLLGSVSGKSSPREVFGELAPHLLAAECGPTATPAMCRRVSALDAHALFCNSDAHSLDHLGREYTLLATEATYAAIMQALRQPANGATCSFTKFPVVRAAYYYNFCSDCDRASPGETCPHCHRPLVIGTHDRLEAIADRPAPLPPPDAPAFRQLLPLSELLAEALHVGVKSKSVQHAHAQLLGTLGSERRILTEARLDELLQATTADFARAIVDQRETPAPLSLHRQLAWDF
jgi:ATP-dependent DNA helicase UvrD/PcrA